MTKVNDGRLENAHSLITNLQLGLVHNRSLLRDVGLSGRGVFAPHESARQNVNQRWHH